MKEQYIETKFQPDTLRLIEQVNRVLDQYSDLGYDLTVRQVYYQLVTKNLIPNSKKSYNRLKSTLSKGRKAGLIDWDMIVDRTRSVVIPPHWKDPAEMARVAANSFRIDKWVDQPNHVEVMVEKDALAGILEPVCEGLDIAFTANKGYSSDSAMYLAGKRIGKKFYDEEKQIFILYLGDHDPSGMDMDRDILERLEMYGDMQLEPLEVERLALLMAQIDEMDVPENPAKETDSRAAGYIAEFGSASWELDAVEPTELARLVTDAVTNLRDPDKWDKAVEKEEEMRKELSDFADNYGKEE